MPELTFTRHFKINWQARVGGEPVAATVQHIIHTSVRIQKSFPVEKEGAPFRVLAIYWHPALDIVIKLDPIQNCAVTVMSRACWRADNRACGREDNRETEAAGDDPGPAASITEMFLRRQRRTG